MANQEPLGLALIGCGAFGMFCLESFSRMDEVRVAAVSDVRTGVADEFARKFNVPAHYDSDELIARDDVRIVHIATPPSTHHELAVKAIRAGKHVLCEKPLAVTVEQGSEILAAAAQANVLAPVNFILRYNQVTDAVKAVIDSGVLGKVLAARLTNCASDTPLLQDHWFWDREVSGGIFIEHGVHFFDLYSHWLGPAEVLDAHTETREGTDQQDRVMCTLRHAGGAVSSHYHAFDQYLVMDRTDHRLVCELGDIVVNGWIPLDMTVYAATDDAGSERLAACCPGAKLEVLDDYGTAHAEGLSRGRTRHITRRIRLPHTPEPDKQAVYAASVRQLLADQIATIRDPSHQRRVAEQNGQDALVLAETAAKLAAKRS